MKNTTRYFVLILGVVLIQMLISCGKDDEPASPPIPTITAFAPESGAIGTSVTIKGTNFSTTTSENKVLFHDGIRAVVTDATATELTVTVPDEAETGAIKVSVNDQSAVSDAEFNVIPPPVITAFAPESGAVGTTVTITGMNFNTTTSENMVTFHDGIRAVVTGATATELTVTVPDEAETGAITVSVNDQSVTSDDDFTLTSASVEPTSVPTIIAFVPKSGAAGTRVTITGMNFSTTTSENTVTFHDGIHGVVTGATVTELTVTVPEEAKTGAITVTVNGQSAVSGADFTMIAAVAVGFESPTMTLHENSGTQNIPLTFSQATQEAYTVVIRIDNSYNLFKEDTHDKTLYGTDYTITGANVKAFAGFITVSLAVPAGSTEVNLPLTIIDDIIREPEEKIVCSIEIGPSLQVIGDASDLTVTIPASDPDALWTSYGLKTHETSGTSGVKVFAVDGEDYGDDWMANTHGNRVLKTFEVNAAGKHTIVRIIDRAPFTRFGVDYPNETTVNANGYAYANENTRSTAIFTTSTDSSPRYQPSFVHLYTMGSHPLYKPAIEEAEYIEKGHVLMISSLENTTLKDNADGSSSLVFSDDFHDHPLSGVLDEGIAMTGKGLANTIFVGVIAKLSADDASPVAEAAIKDNGIYQRNAIFTEIIKSLPERDATTSHATPKVAARAADILAANPMMTSRELRAELFRRAPLTEVDFLIGVNRRGTIITEKRMVHILP
ncbi:MAG: IPT/TIG domain-containing protein [Ekhidna sp.]|nr:IPT/TIG domain-containing protein [Ekhidna sp.]